MCTSTNKSSSVVDNQVMIPSSDSAPALNEFCSRPCGSDLQQVGAEPGAQYPTKQQSCTDRNKQEGAGPFGPSTDSSPVYSLRKFAPRVFPFKFN
ncbi:hypothetical protein ACFX19_011899 [Malus domestica]